MNNHTIIGIDLAKSVFQVAVMSNGQITSNKRLKRSALIQFVATTPPTTIAMEACYSSHSWARVCETHGHKVQLIPAQHVKPFTRGNKTDANDSIAIIEASQRPNLKFVPVKSIHQQDIQSLHRIRERLVCNRTALMNQTRGLLSEYGIVSPVGKKGFMLGVEKAMNDNELSSLIQRELAHALEELQSLSERIALIEGDLHQYVSENQNCRILHSIPGIGVMNASALICKYGNGSQFNNARSLAVNLGLTPKVSSSGTTKYMQGISKRGDPYCRKQLIHGARALLGICEKRPDDALCRWAARLKKRRGFNIAVVALANRLARLVWVLLHKQETYRPLPV